MGHEAGVIEYFQGLKALPVTNRPCGIEVMVRSIWLRKKVSASSSGSEYLSKTCLLIGGGVLFFELEQMIQVLLQGGEELGLNGILVDRSCVT